jgi:hypothetical protein
MIRQLSTLVTIVALCLLCFSALGAEQKAGVLPINEAVSWLEKEAHRIIRASKREMKDGTAAFPPQVGIGYEAFWLRDYEYTLEGSISSYSTEELLAAATLFVRKLDPNGAGVDCIKFDGTPIYKPGFGSLGESSCGWKPVHGGGGLAYLSADKG